MTLSVPGHEDWLEGMFHMEAAKEVRSTTSEESFENETATFDYTFTPPPGYSKQLRKREQRLSKVRLAKRKGRAVEPINL